MRETWPFRLLMHRGGGMLCRNPIPDEAAPIALSILYQLHLRADRHWVLEEMKPCVKALQLCRWDGRPRKYWCQAAKQRKQFYQDAIMVIHENGLTRFKGALCKSYFIRGNMMGYEEIGRELGLIGR